MAFIPHWKGLSDSRVKGANITKMIYTKTNIDFFVLILGGHSFQWPNYVLLLTPFTPVHYFVFVLLLVFAAKKLGWGLQAFVYSR